MLRSAFASLAGPSTLRTAAVSPSAIPTYIRHFQTTTPALKKRRAHEVEEDFDTTDEAESDDLSLFGDAEAAVSPGTVLDRKSHRATIKQSIISAAATKGRERREAAAAMRVGSLRKVVQLSDTPEEVEELRSLLRAWRVLGGKVTAQTAREIVGRCCNLGRPDLAQEFVKDRVQFGLPDVPSASQKKLDAALASFTNAPAPASAESAST